MSLSRFSFYPPDPAAEVVDTFVATLILAGAALMFIAFGLKMWSNPECLANMFMPHIDNEDLSPRFSPETPRR